MQRPTISLLFITALLLAGCNFRRSGNGAINAPRNEPVSVAQSAQVAANTARGSGSAGRFDEMQQGGQQGQQGDSTALASAAAAQTSAQAIERKIIRNAELVIETDAPNNLQPKITAIAEKHGGFVVTTEANQNKPTAQGAPATVVNVTVRVPASTFGAALDEMRRLDGRILREKITGQDVTEEFIDLEARLRAKRALEAQFLEIMKRAQKVTDALEVQTQIADVRGEIERMEGRRRFLENQAALSTITVMLHTPAPLVAATTGGFWYGIKASFGDGLDAASHIIFGLVQFVIVMIPIALFILLPAWLLLRWLYRRVDWLRRAPARVSAANQE